MFFERESRIRNRIGTSNSQIPASPTCVVGKPKLSRQDMIMFSFCCVVGGMFVLLACDYGSTVVPPRTDEDPIYKPSPDHTSGFSQTTPLATAIGSWWWVGVYYMHRSKAVKAIRRLARFRASRNVTGILCAGPLCT